MTLMAPPLDLQHYCSLVSTLCSSIAEGIHVSSCSWTVSIGKSLRHRYINPLPPNHEIIPSPPPSSSFTMTKSVQVMAVVVMALLVSCSLVSARVLLGEQASFQDQKFKHHHHGKLPKPALPTLPTLPTLPIGLPSCSPPPASPAYEEPPAYESPPYTPSPAYESPPPPY